MKAPAARLNDPFTCPVQSEKGAHTGGILLLPGATDVFIQQKRAARVGDQGTCTGTGEPNPIVMGSGSVFINGRPAARQGDFMGHGGTIQSGSTKVWIGG